jgi:hypothetical protein
MAGVVIGAIVGSAISDVVGAAVSDAVLGMVIDSGITAGAADVLGASIATANFIGGAAGLVAGGLASVAVQSLVGTNAPSQAQSAVASAQAQGILINSQSNVDPIPVIYGRRRVGGTRVFIEVSGSSNEYLHIVLVLAEGPVAAIDNIYIDDVLSTDSKFAGLVTIHPHLGTPGDPADAALMTAVPKWASSCTLSNLAYLYVQLKYDGNAFSGLPTITADVRGRTLFDPRDSATRYANNAALVVRDYLINPLYGRGIAAASIDDASFAAAATSSDARLTAPVYTDTCTADPSTDLLTFAQSEPIDTGDGVAFSTTGSLPAPLTTGTTYYAVKVTDTTYKLATSAANAVAGTTIDLTTAGSGTITASHVDYATYAVDGSVDTSQTAYDNIKALLTACRGMLVFSAGKYRLILDQVATPASFGFTEDNITGSWVITQAGKRTKFNRVTAGFYNPAKLWQPDLAMVESTALRAVDNGLLLEAKIDLPFSANVYRAQNIGQQTLNQSRYGLSVKFAAFQEGLRCEVGDVVPITHSTPGWTNKLFRILQIELKDTDEVTITAQEYDPSVYQLANLAPASIIPRSNLPDPFSVGIPGTPAATENLYSTTGSSGVKSRATMVWTAPNDAFVVSYELAYKPGADTNWRQIGLVSDVQTRIDDIAPGTYDFRVRAINAMGVRSDWSPITTREIFGLTAPPADIAGFTVIASGNNTFSSWTLVPYLDVRIGGRIAVRWTPLLTGAVWENGVAVADLPGDAVSAVMPLLTGTYLAKARDSSGNWSVNPAMWSMTAAAAAGFPNSSTLTESPAFSGTKASVIAVEGGIQLDAAGLVDAQVMSIDAWVSLDSTGGVAASGTYDFALPMDFGTVALRRFTANVFAQAFDTGDYVDSMSAIDSWDALDGTAINDAGTSLLASISQDGTSYSAWFPFMAADLTCRSAKFRLAMSSNSPNHNIVVSQLAITANW